MINNFSTRGKAILIGLYLSKFDDKGLQALGFEGMYQAFNVLRYAVASKPASIKNYRDEFDPYFPNKRKGWYQRGLREHCKKILDEFSELSFDGFTDLIESIILKDYEFEKFISKIEKKDYSETIAKRLATGEAAEEYFKANYNFINDFTNYELKDTTKLACGFDFKLTLNSSYYCVEVKGLNTLNGNILMTEKEFSVAQNLKQKYCLFVVTNFVEKPVHQYYFDPLDSRLEFKKIGRQVTQVNYSTVL